MELAISGKRALVIGASQGIGKAIALGLAKEGVKVAVVARNADKLEALVREMGGASVGHRAVSADLMLEGNPTRVAQEMFASHGSIDIVVHSVGGPLGIKHALASAQDWYRVWRFNLGIAIEMNAVLIPPMQQCKWGRVIHISSISAETVRGSVPYASVKAALNAYIKGLGRAVAPDGVVVAGLMPGAVLFEGGYWDTVSKNNPEIVQDFLRHHMAIGRFGTVEEISSLAVFLSSEVASFAVGTVVPIDGGTM